MSTEPVFMPWPKIARLNRGIIITEKLDGSNAAVGILEDGAVYAQSRSRILSPGKGTDNFGFASWVNDKQEELREALGVGLHFGEWWGVGIQRGYGLHERRFSLFNVRRHRLVPFNGMGLPNVGVVPVLYEGPFGQEPIDRALLELSRLGSFASPGFMNPEGIVAFFQSSSTMYKVTLDGDDAPKGATS